MTFRIGSIAGLLLLVASPPLAAQERTAPPAPPPIERLERLRIERLQESLGLTDEQAEALARQLQESREAMRQSFERQREAMESLRGTLGSDPVDEAALRRSLAEVAAARERMEQLRGRQLEELERTLTLEQRARFLLFNRQFDTRLRELVEKHRGHGPRAPHGLFRGPGAPPGIPGFEGREPSRQERIEFLEKRIEEMQRQLEELRSDDEG